MIRQRWWDFPFDTLQLSQAGPRIHLDKANPDQSIVTQEVSLSPRLILNQHPEDLARGNVHCALGDGSGGLCLDGRWLAPEPLPMVPEESVHISSRQVLEGHPTCSKLDQLLVQ